MPTSHGGIVQAVEPKLLPLSQALHLPDRVLRVQHREQVLGQKYINQDPKIYQSRPQNISIKTLKYIHQSEKIFNRWWGKVRGVPEVENPLLVLSGLAMANRFFLQLFLFVLYIFVRFLFLSILEMGIREPQSDRLSLMSRCAVTEVKKMVAR